jgi:hypothetical protein
VKLESLRRHRAARSYAVGQEPIEAWSAWLSRATSSS